MRFLQQTEEKKRMRNRNLNPIWAENEKEEEEEEEEEREEMLASAPSSSKKHSNILSWNINGSIPDGASGPISFAISNRTDDGEPTPTPPSSSSSSSSNPPLPQPPSALPSPSPPLSPPLTPLVPLPPPPVPSLPPPPPVPSLPPPPPPVPSLPPPPPPVTSLPPPPPVTSLPPPPPPVTSLPPPPPVTSLPPPPRPPISSPPPPAAPSPEKEDPSPPKDKKDTPPSQKKDDPSQKKDDPSQTKTKGKDGTASQNKDDSPDSASSPTSSSPNSQHRHDGSSPDRHPNRSPPSDAPTTPSAFYRPPPLSPSLDSGGSSSLPSSSTASTISKNSFATGAIAAGSVAAALAVVIAILFLILKKRKKRIKSSGGAYNPPPTSDMFHGSKSVSPAIGTTYPSFRGPGYPVLTDSGGSKSWFTYEELKDITNGFSSENLLGEGGFGCVYKGCLPDGRMVAVKQLKLGSGQGDREFKAEVEIISRVHHRHLVSLVGYCIEEHQRLLVYEYLPNKTLEYHLHGKDLPVMEWSKRVKIAVGSARGLAYLHQDCHPRIIHRDIKSANILLDSSYEAQVSDFGLAKLTNDSHSHVSTRVMGTFGYMAPEYASSGKLTDRSDVFSFGVVLLELITGRKPVDPSQQLGDESLVEWVRPLLMRALETGECEEFVDPRLENNFVKTEMLLMIEAAAACVRHAASKRPRMAQVVRALDHEGDLSDLSNGMKFGHSQVYNSAQYSAEIRLFHTSGLDSEEFSSKSSMSGFSSESRTREATP